MKRHPRKTITAPELLMLSLVFAVVTVLAIPKFSNIQKDARNTALLSAVGQMRGHLAFAAKLIAVKEDPTHRYLPYPTLEELRAGVFLDAHPSLKGKSIFDPTLDLPKSSWSNELADSILADVYECDRSENGSGLEVPGPSQRSWCYRSATGEIWISNQSGDLL